LSKRLDLEQQDCECGKERNRSKRKREEDDEVKRITLVAGPPSSPPEGIRAPSRSTSQRNEDGSAVELQGGREGTLGNREGLAQSPEEVGRQREKVRRRRCCRQSRRLCRERERAGRGKRFLLDPWKILPGKGRGRAEYTSPDWNQTARWASLGQFDPGFVRPGKRRGPPSPRESP
jgi:hypothetical protein